MYRYIFLISLVLCASANADSGFVTPSSLQYDMNELEKELELISTRSRKIKEISIEFKKVAKNHTRLLTEYVSQKSICKNLEKLFYSSYYSNNYEKKTLTRCYKNLKRINYNYEYVNNSFLDLEKRISLLMEMLETDLATLPTLEVQLDSIKEMLSFDSFLLNKKMSYLR